MNFLKRSLLTAAFCTFVLSLSAQSDKTPAVLYLKDGTSIDVAHLGKKKCGEKLYMDNFIIIRGKYMGSVTEIKEYRDIQKLILIGFDKAPVASVGNEKARVSVIKKNGVEVTLDECEVAMSCFTGDDKYNQIVVQIMNPLTEQTLEKVIETKNIQSIVFK